MVDFVIIMPLGDRLMANSTSRRSSSAGSSRSYALAAGVASLLASFVMDRFDRKAVLLTMYGGFALSTLFCGLARNYESLLVSRTLAGVFGGLAAVTIMAVIGDVFPPEKRGRATGAVMSSFAVASIVGLAAGLMLAEWYGRGAPFVALAGLSAAVWVLACGAAAAGSRSTSTTRAGIRCTEFAAVVREPNHLWAFAFSFFLVLGTFTVGVVHRPVPDRDQRLDARTSSR